MNKVIPSELNIGLRTVELRRANIMKKMAVASLADRLKTVMSLERTDEDAPSEGVAPPG